MEGSAAYREECARLFMRLIGGLHSVNVSTEGIEMRLARIADRLFVGVKVMALQSHASLEVTNDAGSSVHIVPFEFSTHWNLRKLDDLLVLCDRLEAGEVTVGAAHRELDVILSRGQLYPKYFVVICYAIYGAAVAARVGGGGLEMAVASLVGLTSGVVHFGTIASRRIDMQKSFLGALIATFVAIVLTVVLPPFDFARAVFGGIVLLVPAMVITVATFEIVGEDVESGLARLAYGLIRFLMMGFGVTAAVKLWTLMAPIEGFQTAVAMPFALKFTIMVIGGMALVFCLQGRRHDLPWILSGVLLAFLLQEATKSIFGGNGSAFITAFGLTLAGIWLLDSRGRSPHLMIFPGLLQIAPGFLGTEAVLSLIRGSEAAPVSDQTFFNVMLVALQIVMGIGIAWLFRPTKKKRPEHVPQPHLVEAQA